MVLWRWPLGRERDRWPTGVKTSGRPIMAAAHPHALQDTFLEHVRKHDVPVTVFLASGIRLQGTVAGFDSYALLFSTAPPPPLLQKPPIPPPRPGGAGPWARVFDPKGPPQ